MRAHLDDDRRIVLTSETGARWINSEPDNLAAAAMDADAWMELIERMHDMGRWPLEVAASRETLTRCRRTLRAMLARDAESKARKAARDGARDA